MPEQQQDILITIIVASVFFVLIGVFLLVLLFLFLRRQRKNQREKEEMKFKFDKTLLNTQIEIQAQTLGYIASEIHDNIGQILSLSRLHYSQLTPGNFAEKSEEIENLLDRAFSDLREISHNLKNNSFHQIGLIDSIEQLLLTIEKSGKYTTSFEYNSTNEEDVQLPEKDIILYRITQEVINNIIKHAMADHIDVVIDFTNDDFTISISDNGKGFDTNIIKENRQGIGLDNIFTRAKLIGTSVNIESELGKGTTVILKTKSSI